MTLDKESQKTSLLER